MFLVNAYQPSFLCIFGKDSRLLTLQFIRRETNNVRSSDAGIASHSPFIPHMMGNKNRNSNSSEKERKKVMTDSMW